jgi:hypothetical protein
MFLIEFIVLLVVWSFKAIFYLLKILFWDIPRLIFAEGGRPNIDTQRRASLSELDWKSAEAYAVRDLRARGFTDARLTGNGTDGGIDVRSSRAVAQVKHWSRPVGLQEVQRLYGAAVAERRSPYFYSRTGYTRPAIEFARQNNINLITYGSHVRTPSVNQVRRTPPPKGWFE